MSEGNLEQRKRTGDLRAYTANDWLQIVLRQLLAVAVLALLVSVIGGGALCFLSSVLR